MNKYLEFIKSKEWRIKDTGFSAIRLNNKLFPFQKQIVQQALNRGRFGIFADCGLGKTFMELEWAHQVSLHTKQPVLILCPLAVSGQTLKEAAKFGYTDISKVGQYESAIEITNYEQLGNIDVSRYSGIVLDESSIIKHYQGAYRNLIMSSFRNTPYKLACTATPAPNDPMELGNHSEFLGNMSYNELLAMYFVHDGGETAKWRLKGHAVSSFYDYISTWATMLTMPSDIGFDDIGYILPELNFIEKQIRTPARGLSLFNEVAISATDFNKELRLTQDQRMNQVANIVNNSDENFVIWIKHTQEGEVLKNLIPDAVEVKGSDSSEYKEDKLIGFSENQFRVLITKTSIASYGLNYQNCHNTVFSSLDYSFEALYQAIRRFLRFGQTKDVNAFIITTDTMKNVITAIKRKQYQFDEMRHQMTKKIKHEYKNN